MRYCKTRYANRTQDDAKQLHVLIAALKIACTNGAKDILQTCRECCGGQGYLTSNLICSLRCDVEAFVTIDGDNTVLLQQVGGGVLAEFQRQYGENMGLKEKASFMGREAVRTIRERNPVKTHQISEDHLFNPEFQLAAMRYRESKQTSRLARRLQRAIKDMSFFAAWNEALMDVSSLGMSFIERCQVEYFITAIDELNDQVSSTNQQARLKHPLQMLSSLLALVRMEADPWFLASGYLSSTKHEAISDSINRLCVMLRPHALSLVQAIQLPNHLFHNTLPSLKRFSLQP